MRSTSSTASLLLSGIGLLAALGFGQGCGDSAVTSASLGGDDQSPARGDSSSEPPPSTSFIGDAAAAPEAKYRGSPLCHITVGTCDPDEDSNSTYDDRAPGTVSCQSTSNPDPGMSGGTVGCRVTAAADAPPQCVGSSDPENGDGGSCEKGSDCAPGFDCVQNDGVGVCRHYCCAGTCEDNRSKNGGDTFCDVQRLRENSARVPVCMPIKSCTLFEGTACTQTETCALVSENGATGCVPKGPQGVGESCDEDHCKAGLTCLGQPGTRTCYQLCRTNGTPSCSQPQTCQTSTIFDDPTVGVCDDS